LVDDLPWIRCMFTLIWRRSAHNLYD